MTATLRDALRQCRFFGDAVSSADASDVDWLAAVLCARCTNVGRRFEYRLAPWTAPVRRLPTSQFDDFLLITQGPNGTVPHFVVDRPDEANCAGNETSAAAAAACYSQSGETIGALEAFENVLVHHGTLKKLRCGCVRDRSEPLVNDKLTALQNSKSASSSSNVVAYARVVYIDAPQADSFQHFIDAYLPKLAVAWPLLIDRTTRIFAPLPYPGDSSMVGQFLALFGLNRSRLVTDDVFVARQLFSACETPCVNDALFKTMHNMVLKRLASAAAAAANDSSSSSNNNMSRRPAVFTVSILDRIKGVHKNKGRELVNTRELIDALTAECANGTVCATRCNVTVFNHLHYHSLAEVGAYFARVWFAVGPHGGALYNTLLMPQNATVIEVFPASLYRENLSKQVPWLLSSGFQQRYWRLHTDGDFARIRVDVDAVVTILRETCVTYRDAST